MSRKFKLILTLSSLVALSALVAVAFLWMRLQKIQVATDTSDTETTALIGQVGKSLLLPKGEDPELLTVSSLDEVKGQPFFANALVGDKVLIYKEAAKAILWRPSIKKIIEVYPINLSAQ